MAPPTRPAPRRAAPPSAFWALAAVAAAGVGWGAHEFQRFQIRKAAERQLATMAELKRDQVTAWLEYQRTLASAVTLGTAMAMELEQVLRAPGPPPAEALARWLPRLRTVEQLEGYVDVTLLRLDGTFLLSSRSHLTAPAIDAALAREVLRSLAPAVSTIHRGEDLPGRPPCVDVVAPLVAIDGADQRTAVALLVLRIDPRSGLYPMIKKLPLPSESAEIVLGEPIGDQLLFLTDLRNRPGAALELRLPIATSDTLLAQAARGARGLLEGKDYRGEPVLGAVQEIPGTGWLLLAKEDVAELYAPLWTRTLASAAIALALLSAALLAFRYWLRHRTAALSARASLESRLMLEAVLDAIPARVFWKDRDLRFLGCNQALAEDAGLPGPEAIVGKDDSQMPWAEQASAVRADDRAVLGSGVPSLGIEEPIAIADGRTVWVRRNKVPLRGPDGEIRGVLGTFEDLTPQRQAEAAARAEHARVRAVLENAGFGICITDREGRMLESNPEWAHFLGYGLDELAALTLVDVTYPVDREASRRNLEGVYEGVIASYTQEKRYVRKDGEVVWGLVAVTPIHQSDGRVGSTMGIVADITERKRMEQELASVAERLSLATQAAGIGIWDWDVQRDVLVWDDAMYRLYGLRSDDFGGAYEAWQKALHPADLERAQGDIEAALRGEREFAPEFRVRWPDGSVHHIQAASRTVRDAAGQPIRMVGVNLEITARKQIEEQLRTNERFLKAVADALPGMVGYWNRDLRCTFANRHYLEWFGRTPPEMQGVTMRELMGDELFRQNEPYANAALGGEVQRFERAQRKADGSTGHTWTHYIPDLAGDEVRGFFVLVTDITELKAAQLELERLNEALRERTRQAESASRAKSDFLANMSHEIRTPMNAIMGLSHLLLGSELAPKQRDYLARIQSASRSLLAIINDILDLSKIEANKMEVERVAFEVSDVFQHVESLVADQARGKGLVLRTELPPDVPRQLVGDALRLGQVLLNLANNAVKFTERGWVAISARVAEEESDCIRLRFTIRDTGIGIPADALARLFQPFSQADGSTTRRFGGTGLGLSISRKLVELMGGELAVQSSPGEGSTFSFVIPLERAARPERRQRSLAGRRVLVVDNDPAFRALAADILSGMGMVLRTVSSGAQALEALHEAVARPSQGFDVVLLDWRMPDLDGMETARRIRDGVRNAAQLVLILTTAYGREYVNRDADLQLFDGLLLKPVEPAVFRDVMEEAFRKRRGLAYEPRAANGAGAAPGSRRGRVLIAEDNETNRLVVQELLASTGIEVEEALNGREAVAKALAPGARFDVVLMDVQMPEMDGFEAAARIREVLPELPIVAVTAHAMEVDRQKTLEAGMRGHVSKPFEPRELWLVLDRWLPARGPAAGPARDGPHDGARTLDGRFLTALCRDLETSARGLGRARSGGDPALAGEVAHALKGLALPSELAGLRERARALEQAVREGAPWLAKAEELEAALGPAALTARLRAQEQPEPTGIGPRSPPEELRALLVRAAAKIRRRSLGAKDHVDDLRARVGPDLLLRRVEDCLDRVDFAEAEAALHELAEAMGLPLDEKPAGG